MKWRRKRVDLAERLRPYVNPGPPPEPMVDADPIRMFLFRWMIETGDPIEVVAKGFDLDEGMIRGLVSRDVLRLRRAEAVRIAARLGLSAEA